MKESDKMDFTRLKYYIDSLAANDLPYCDISVRLNREEVFRHSMGHIDAEGTKTPQPDTLQWIYSMSKVITCTAVLRLVEKGLLSLEDKVSKYLPEYEVQAVKCGVFAKKADNPILIKHIFSMRSGIDYDWACIADKIGDPNITTREFIKGLSRKVLCFEPGTDYTYGLGHDVLAAVAEVITGKKFRDYLNDEIFAPLGLKNIGFHPTEKQLNEQFAQAFVYDHERFRSSPRDMNCAFCFGDDYDSGGAGLFSSLDDYMEIADALSNGGVAKNGYRILNPETIDLMRTNLQTENSMGKMKPGYGYGLGVRTMVDRKVGRSLGPVGEFGWDGAALSYVLIDPENHVTVVFTTQLSNGGVFYHTTHPYLRNLVYDALGLAKEY